jgi:hypothetical protein
MTLTFAAFATVTVLATTASALAADGPISFKSVDIDLPFGDAAFPPGPGADTVTGNCLGCHSAEMILYQPPLSRATWQAEVNKMRTAYAAPIDGGDVKQIVDYLARIKGAD